MSSLVNYAIYDMFSLEPNDFVKQIQPYRDGTVIDQLISTRHMWSQALSSISNQQELEQILIYITEDVGKNSSQFLSNPSKQIEPYALRKFRLSEFLTFLQAGKNKYKLLIENIAKQQAAESGQDEDDLETRFPLNLKYKTNRETDMLVYLDVVLAYKATLTMFGKVFDKAEVNKAIIEIKDSKSLDPPKVVVVGGAPYTSENHNFIYACLLLGIRQIPILFSEKYGKVVGAQINNNIYRVKSVFKFKTFTMQASDKEFGVFIDYHRITGRFDKLSWVKVKYKEEEKEFQKFAKNANISENDLMRAYEKASIKEFTKDMLSKIDDKSISEVEDYEKLASVSKNHKKILIEMYEYRKLYAPIVLEKNSKYSLIAGATRFMISNLLDINPKVVVIKM